MTSCPICQSEFSGESNVCPFCGTTLAPVAPDRGIARSTVQRAIDAAREALALAEDRGAEVNIPTTLLQRAQDAFARGDGRAAEELAAAVKRASLLAMRRAKVEAAIAALEAKAGEVRSAGGPMQDLEQAIAEARSLVRRGDLPGASEIIDRASPMVETFLAFNRGRQIIQDARSKIAEAREKGTEVNPYLPFLAQAEEALAENDMEALAGAVERLARALDFAQRNSKAQQRLAKLDKLLEEAHHLGIDISQPSALVAQARRALKSGHYADMDRLAAEATQLLAESRARSRIARTFEKARAGLREEAREGGETAPGNELLAAAEDLIARGNPRAAQAKLNELMEALRVAVARRREREMVEYLEREVKELRDMGAGGEGVAEATAKAREAFEAGHGAGLRRAFTRGKRLAHEARLHREREILIHTVEEIVDRVGAGGVSSMGTKELLAHVSEAIGTGRVGDLEEVVKAKFTAEKTKKEKEVAEALLHLRLSAEDLRDAGLDTAKLEAGIAAAQEAAQRGKPWQAAEMLPRLQDMAQPLTEALEEAARKELARAKTALEELAAQGMELAEGRELFRRAEEMVGQGKDAKALGLARSALVLVERGREEHQAEIARHEAQRQRVEQATRDLQGRIGALGEHAARLKASGAPVEALEADIARALQDLAAGSTEEALFRTQLAEQLARGIEEALGRFALEVVAKAQSALDDAKAKGMDVTQEEASLKAAAGAREARQYQEASRLAQEVLLELQNPRPRPSKGAQGAARDQEVQELLDRVRGLLDELKKAGIDISGGEQNMAEATQAVARGELDQAQGILRDMEDMATNLKASFVEAALDFIAKAKAVVEGAQKLSIVIPEGDQMVREAQDMFREGHYDKAVELAKLAERRAKSTLMTYIDEAQAEVQTKVEGSKARIRRLRKTLKDLARADISIEGAEEATVAAQEALEEADFDAVDANLTHVEEMSRGLASGLKVAAHDLLERTRADVEEAKGEGFNVPRAEQVLVSAMETWSEERYVEALEYCKVIEDILQDARLKRESAGLAHRLSTLRENLAGAKAAGLATAEAEETLMEALEASQRGQVERARDLTASLERMVGRLGEEARASAEAQVARGRTSLEEARSRGLPTASEEARLKEAEAALGAGHLAEAMGILRELHVGLEAQARARTREEILRARDEFMASVAGARAVGVELAAVDVLLGEVLEAVDAGDEARAIDLLKSARGEAKRSIASFTSSHRPEIQLEIPGTTLQEGRWNRVVVGVSNQGSLAAQSVAVSMEADADTKQAEAVEELAPGDRRSLEVGVRPRAPGELALKASATYRSILDPTPRAARGEWMMQVTPQGTYVVEDLFLIHSDGRLIAHESRRYYKGVDEDIFSGMLTIVQDFVRDSFRQTKGVGLKRLDFGDSKILIERGTHIYLAAVVHGQEPRLLPLYMAEVIRDIEVSLAPKLERWTGLMADLPGISEIVTRLFLLTGPGTGAEGTDSAVASASRLIEAVKGLGADASEAEAALAAASRRIEEDVVSAMPLVEEAVERALRIQEAWRAKLQSSVSSLNATLAELRATGAETSDLEAKVQEAWEALGSGDMEKARVMIEGAGQQLSSVRGAVLGGTLRSRVAEAEATLGQLAQGGEEVGEMAKTLDRAKRALGEGDIRGTQEALEGLTPDLERRRRDARARAGQKDLVALQAELRELGEMVPVPPELQTQAAEARTALEGGDLDQGLEVLARAREGVGTFAAALLRERHPRVFVRANTEGLQSNKWNWALLEVTNRGNWSARDMEVQVLGDVEVKGLEKIENLAPNEVRRMEIGIKPARKGAVPLDVEVTYARLLDKTRFAVRDSKDLSVEAPGTYPVSDAFLLLPDGRLAAHEGRAYHEAADREAFANLLRNLEEFTRDSFRQRRQGGLRRLDLGPKRILVERGPREMMAVVVDGREPRLLPLYMVEALNEIDAKVGAQLASGGASPEEVGPILRRLLFATEVKTADLGDLQESPITEAAGGTAGGEELPRPLAAALTTVEQRDYAEALTTLRSVTQPFSSPESVANQIRERALAVAREGGNVQIDDVTLQGYVELLKKVDRAIRRARAKANVDPTWPLRKIAIRTMTEEMCDGVKSFATVILHQGNAKELDVVRPGEIWRGLELKMDIKSEAVAKAYKGVLAKKIELILKSQDPWKIRMGLERGEYSLGLEGMKLKITPEMVSFTPLLPPHVVIQEFDSGIVYLDTKVTAEVKAEGIAQEIIRIAQESREELGLPPRARLDLAIMGASVDLVKVLQPLRDNIAREAGASAVRFLEAEEATEGVVAECEIAGEKFTLVVRGARAAPQGGASTAPPPSSALARSPPAADSAERGPPADGSPSPPDDEG